MIQPYYKISPMKILKDIQQSKSSRKVQIKEMELYVNPHVYPSDKFRTTNFILDSIQPFLSGTTVCDMGCGMGIVGLFALKHGAKRVVQVDINPFAVENTKLNKALYEYSNEQSDVIQSDCFDKVPKQIFDFIVFNIPFHSDFCKLQNPIEYALHDPQFQSTRKFLNQAIEYSNSNTKIIIAFSNKGDVEGLEQIFGKLGYNWKLWKIINKDQEYDNRLYQLEIKGE